VSSAIGNQHGQYRTKAAYDAAELYIDRQVDRGLRNIQEGMHPQSGAHCIKKPIELAKALSGRVNEPSYSFRLCQIGL
jgi:hypothetical protein